MSSDIEEFQKQLVEAHNHEKLIWLRNTITVEFLKYLEGQELELMQKMRKLLCSTPPETDKAAKLAVKSQTLQEIIEYARRTE